MATIRVEKSKDYTVMSNYHFKEKNMSLKAKGLLSLMLSLPDNWDYSIAGLVAICKENETSVKSALEELKQFGYVEVIKKMPNETKSGRIEYDYIVFEKKQEGKKQEVENLGVEILCVENQGQLNINQLNTKKENINYKYIVDYLNEKTGANYRSTTANTQTLIRARIKEGFKEEDFIKVIDNMVCKWQGTEWEQYLQPQTLFGTKFEKYLNTNIRRINNGKVREDGSEYANL
jgi:uncharacterized phage protein (TIGR02220 family)